MYIVPFAALQFIAIGIFFAGCQSCTVDPEAIVKSKDGIYHINGTPAQLDLVMADGGIVFNRNNAFSIGVACDGKDFFWSDNNKNFHLSYNGTLCFDFNRDFVFDFFYEKGRYFIIFEHKRIEVKEPDFSAMQAVDLHGCKYRWDGNAWILQP